MLISNKFKSAFFQCVRLTIPKKIAVYKCDKFVKKYSSLIEQTMRLHIYFIVLFVFDVTAYILFLLLFDYA